jgi:dihydropteroate synthase-like protein
MEHLVFLTGHLALPSLEAVLRGMSEGPAAAPFTWEVRDVGVQVAALMTADLIRRRVPLPVAASRIIVPGRCRGDLAALAEHFGMPVERGPEELKDLPRHFNQAAKAISLADYRVQIFAEIVDAPRLTVPQIIDRARQLAADGANVIDLGCLPDTPFAQLEAAVQALKAAGHLVSVDSVDPQELLRGGRAGADYLLSLTLDTLWVADEVNAVPVLIPRTPSDEASLHAAIEAMAERGRPFLADAILDPIPFGFTASICRYQRLRERYPSVAIMFGVGNLTELTEADTSGINALLFGICAELDVAAVLTTQVSGHARRAVREADWSRRIMHAAKSQQMLPKGLSPALMTMHAKHPFPDAPEEIAATAAQVRDPNFRVQVSAQGLHVYNRDGLRLGQGAFELWPQLGLHNDASHAFYMGVELAHAELAWKLGKRYVQDQPLNWGCAYEPAAQDLNAWCAPGSTRPAANPKKPDDE